MTKLRIGLVLGFAAGYYLGAMAGRDRYLQLNRMLRQVGQSDLLGKARAVVDLGRERAHSHDTESLIDVTTAAAYSTN